MKIIMKKILKNLSYYLQYLLLKNIFLFLSPFSAAFSSFLLGFIFRHLGPFLSSSHYGRVNLTLAFPQKTHKEREEILKSSWENIGRTLGEFPHIPKIYQKNNASLTWEVRGEEHLHDIKKRDRPLIFFSGHLGNWEIMPALLTQYDLSCAFFYRAPNNPYIHHYLQEMRLKNTKNQSPFFAKGAEGAKDALRYLAQQTDSKRHLGILGDQKMNDGIDVTFFNRPTKTSPAAAFLALRFNALILMGYIERVSPAHFIFHISPPIDPKEFQGKAREQQDTLHILTQYLMAQLENWIREKPSSWLWCHRRWDKSLYKK